jgi:hypothetical protein
MSQVPASAGRLWNQEGSMDPITSAWIFVAVSLFTGGFSLTKNKSVGVSILLILVAIANYIQFAFFTGLWPIYILAIFSIFVVIALVGAAAVLAVKDARDATFDTK